MTRSNIRFISLTALGLAMLFGIKARAGDGKNLIKNPDFERAGSSTTRAASFDLTGDATRTFAGTAYEFSSMGIALDSALDLNADGLHQASVAQDIPIDSTLAGRWFRFTVRGLPEDGFALKGDNLHLKVDFFADHGKRALDGVTRKIYPIIVQERQNLSVNGVRQKGGAATWKTYAFEFRLPFPEIDQLRVSVGFRGGEGQGRSASFLVDEMALVAIPTPVDAPQSPSIRPAGPVAVDPSKLIPIGGRWSYLPIEGEKVEIGGKGLVVTEKNADRLLLDDGNGHHLNPFAENMSAWLRKGFLDLSGKPVTEDQFRPDNVTITFDASSMIVRAHNLPNHPTGKFPAPRGSGDMNPNYIQEKDRTYYFPLKPERNPDAKAMENRKNTNRALPMGTIGIAVNGVAFFNPFDMDGVDATDLMDRCCGHPSPDDSYHYHKYPVCVKSPFGDEGKEHSPLIGWAFDGFAIYGPYEGNGLMAKDLKENPLNAFNVHQDAQRGWHYHVTPGQFPYIIGGYWGQVDPRNLRRGGGMFAGGGPGGRGGPGGPGGGPPLVVTALDADHDREISAEEIQNAPASLQRLDRDRDGSLSREEVGLPAGPGGRRGFGPGGPGDPGGGRAEMRGPGGPGGPPGGRAGGPFRSPIVSALDKNGDGELSPAEIKASAQSLKNLDRNGDGKLLGEEIHPPGPGPGGPPPR